MEPVSVDVRTDSVERLQQICGELWIKACEFECIGPTSLFVEFDMDANPYAKAYNRAMGRLLTARRLQARN